MLQSEIITMSDRNLSLKLISMMKFFYKYMKFFQLFIFFHTLLMYKLDFFSNCLRFTSMTVTGHEKIISMTVPAKKLFILFTLSDIIHTEGKLQGHAVKS